MSLVRRSTFVGFLCGCLLRFGPNRTCKQVMSMVGWDPEGTYTSKEVQDFAEQAMKRTKDIGKDVELELARFGTRSF